MAKSEKHINEAAKAHIEPRDRSRLGGSHGKGSDVGNERKAGMRAVQEGGSRAEARGDAVHSNEGMAGHLGHAVGELHRQHPEHHHDLGPHHHGTSHIRHEPVGKVYR